MNEFDKIVEIGSSDEVKLAGSFRDLLHTELMFGMSSYVCRYGTLGEGFENVTPARRYYAAIRESYTRYEAISEAECRAMEQHADLLDAIEVNARISWESSKQDTLRAGATLRRSKAKLAATLVLAEDNRRQLQAFLDVVAELQPEIRAKYPLGIEQAEPDNWRAVAKFRSLSQQIKCKDMNLEHIPMPMEEKAALSVELGEPMLAAWMLTEKNMSDRSPQAITKAIEHFVEERKCLKLMG